MGNSRRDRMCATAGGPGILSFGAYTAVPARGTDNCRRRAPYAAMLGLESWFRQRGGFVYEEQPPVGEGPPLVSFTTRTRAGYCQHFAGAMAVMARLLGIPARVAVGFTSGTFQDGSLDGDRPQRSRLGRGLVSGARLGPLRSHARPGKFSALYSFASNSPQTSGRASPRCA